ncbi:MAG: ATP-binding protein [Proteobacteria bacterium]|nr:ATP-binding protein [Pseudomonadota bacterium]
MSDIKPLPVDTLFTPCDPDSFDFETTAELDLLDEIIGQDRAVEAVRFAIGMKHPGYNLFAVGPEGTGKTSLVRKFLETASAQQPVPDDWCYVYDFTEDHIPRAIRLTPGRARGFAEDMEKLIEDLTVSIPAAFATEVYLNRRTKLEEEFTSPHEEAWATLQKEAADQSVALVRTQQGLAIAPMQEGEVLKPEDFQKLDEADQEKLKTAMAGVQEKLEELTREMPRLENERQDKLKALNQEVTDFVTSQLIKAFSSRYNDLPDVIGYLAEVRADVVKNTEFFMPKPQESEAPPLSAARRVQRESPLSRYHVNVMVDNCERTLPSLDGDLGGTAQDIEPGEGVVCIIEGAPVVEEENPTLPNLVGRIEHRAQMGTLNTDYTMIKPGALHRANGGYLVLDARKLLMQPFAWEALKRALITKRIRYESQAEAHGMMTTISLDPEPIPLDVKVILLGEPDIYYTLSQHEPEFRKLFKVQADFDTVMNRTTENRLQYARLIATLVDRETLLPVHRTGMARVVEYGARLAGDSERLSTHMGSIVDLVREADYWARDTNAEVISANHVQKAIDAMVRRSDRVRERLQEQIERDTIVIETDGEQVGEINGLAVLQLDHFSFGKPSRISCRIRMGRGEVIDIEREVALGGPLHTKGVLILSSYIASRFTGDRPLALSASLVFEQSYGGVDGDSASSTELYALLSAISGIPIKQSFAVTGSVDQHGRVQAIGGVNEKIEGFFDICSSRGLTGEQGVLIPHSNAKHLMLRRDVVEAVRDGKFAIHAVETIDQGIEILTGIPAGKADEEGVYPLGSVNRAVAVKLADLARTAQRLGYPRRQNNGDD